MAEVVEYRLEKSLGEINLLIEFGLFNEAQGKEILAKREDFEYLLRRKKRSKLDFLKYIKFEINFLESLDKYRKTVLKSFHDARLKTDTEEQIERKILLLQAKKLNDVIRSRSAHISSLFRKLTTSFQFDKKLWIAYIEFAKSRNWNTRVTALYWRLLRVSSNDPEIWIEAAEYEVEANKAFDSARGLYVRALRHHPNSKSIWVSYFKMEVKFQNLVDLRARIVFKTTSKSQEPNDDDNDELEDIWVDDPCDTKKSESNESLKDDPKRLDNSGESTSMYVRPINDDIEVSSGVLLKIVYENAVKQVDNLYQFIIEMLDVILQPSLNTSKGISSIKEYITADIKRMITSGDKRIPKELVNNIDNHYKFKSYLIKSNNSASDPETLKSQDKSNKSKLNSLYEIYESKGIEETRKMYQSYDKSVKSQTLSLYVGMIQVETWQLMKDNSECQRQRIRSIYDRALQKFGRRKSKLWYEYIRFEHSHAKTLEDFDRINRLYARAQANLEPRLVNKVVEKYNSIQERDSGQDIEYSDYSDLED